MRIRKESNIFNSINQQIPKMNKGIRTEQLVIGSTRKKITISKPLNNNLNRKCK
jgi:hypothetical protein